MAGDARKLRRQRWWHAAAGWRKPAIVLEVTPLYWAFGGRIEMSVVAFQLGPLAVGVWRGLGQWTADIDSSERRRDRGR